MVLWVPSEPVSVSNSNLAYLTSVVGRSYSCNSEQSLVITAAVSINTFRLQVQPFGVTSDQFASGRPALALHLQHGRDRLQLKPGLYFSVKCCT